MKEVQELNVCVVDFGSFISLAEKLAETCAHVNYHSPVEREFRNIDDEVIGLGIPNVHKIESFMHPDVVEETDLFVFPDIGYEGEQLYLKSIGKPVWGSMGGDMLERLRTRFIDTVEKLGLPMVESVKIRGLENLCDYLKEHEDRWVKVNEFRDNMETWHHQDWLHSQPMLRRLWIKFAVAPELVWFVVQKNLPGATEIGYDGLSVDGWFPDSSYQGYEKKNELYLGAMTQYDDLPEEVRLVNEKFLTVLEEYGYRNFFATEIRNFEGTPYFIDPTLRMPGQTGEQLLETMANLAEVIWQGAQGELIQPEWAAKFATSATLNYRGDLEDVKVIRVPEEARPYVKLCRYRQKGDEFHFPANKREDVGVVIGMGDTITDAIQNLKDNFELIGDESVSIKPEGFKDLLEDIEQAEQEGIEFTKGEVPEPASVGASTPSGHFVAAGKGYGQFLADQVPVFGFKKRRKKRKKKK